MKVLVVEGDAGIRESIRLTLIREYGADVSEAANGFDALEHLKRTPFDLVLLDVNLPDINGVRTLQVIRRSHNRSAVPVVILVASADQTKLQEAQRLGVAGYVLKPVQPAALMSRLQEVLMLSERPASPAVVPTLVLTLRRQDSVVLIERDLPFLEFALGQLSRYCRVDVATTSARALQACVEAPPAAIFLGGQEDIATAQFVAQVRHHPRLSGVPIYALMPPERMALTPAPDGVDAVLPRTLDEVTWTAAARKTLHRAPDTAKYLERAVDATRESLASKVAGEVSTIMGLNSRWVHRWLSARIDFEVPDVAWSLTLIASDISAGRIARAEPAAGAGPFSEAVSVSAMTSLAQEAFEALRGEGVHCHDTTPQCEVRTCTGPPLCGDGVVSAEKWVLALQNEILVMVRLSERRERASLQSRRLA